MTDLTESYKKIYENKKMHLWLFILSFLWTSTSMLFDIAIGKPDTYRQNIFDILFGIFIGAYSLKFLHNAINNINNGVLPSFKGISWKIYLGMIKLDIVWCFYALAVIFLSVILYITLVHTIIFPIIIIVLTAFTAVFTNYIYLAFAENFDSKGLYNIVLVFKFIKYTFKDTVFKLCLFLLVMPFAALICILFYAAAAITGIDSVIYIAGDYYLIDFIVFTFTLYFMLVTWYFAFPYSLINIYITKIRPLLKKEKYYVENERWI